MDVFAKAIIDSFQLRTEDKTSSVNSMNQSKKVKAQSTKFELDGGEHVWYLAPLINKLDAAVQSRVLKQATAIMENCAWSVKGKERDKLVKR